MHHVRPHEADEENNGESNGENIDTPEPGALMRSQEETFDEAGLRETLKKNFLNLTHRTTQKVFQVMRRPKNSGCV